LGNLMENTCKWGTSQVRVTVRQNGTNVIATVSDDGPGLPADRLQEVRERGVRLDESVSGSGLGLAIATDLAALYGGSVELFSPGLDGGLAAELKLPAARSHAAR
jgi:signal transduction histidine kinase